MLIVNALYFKSAWTIRFEKANEPKPFHLSNGDIITTEMMTRESSNYKGAGFIYNNNKFTAISIPYEVSTHHSSMCI